MAGCQSVPNAPIFAPVPEQLALNISEKPAATVPIASLSPVIPTKPAVPEQSASSKEPLAELVVKKQEALPPVDYQYKAIMKAKPTKVSAGPNDTVMIKDYQVDGVTRTYAMILSLDDNFELADYQDVQAIKKALEGYGFSVINPREKEYLAHAHTGVSIRHRSPYDRFAGYQDSPIFNIGGTDTDLLHGPLGFKNVQEYLNDGILHGFGIMELASRGVMVYHPYDAPTGGTYSVLKADKDAKIVAEGVVWIFEKDRSKFLGTQDMYLEVDGKRVNKMSAATDRLIGRTELSLKAGDIVKVGTPISDEIGKASSIWQRFIPQ